MYKRQQLEHPDLQVSTGILYRKWNAYQEHDLAGMLGIRGGWNKHSSGIPQVVWEAFLWFWLDENQDVYKRQRRWLPLPVSVMLVFRCFLV